MACSEGGFRDKCRTPKVSEGCSDGASKGASGRASGRLRRVYRSGASGIRVILRKAPKGSFGVARPEGVFEGVGLPEGLPGGSSKEVANGSSERVLRGGFRRGFRRGFREGLRRRLRRGQAVPGRPIGDQRRHVSGLSLLPGVSERVDAWRRRRGMPAARPADSNRSARGKTERDGLGGPTGAVG